MKFVFEIEKDVKGKKKIILAIMLEVILFSLCIVISFSLKLLFV